MGEFVSVVAKRHRGWPWSEESAGMTPMYGEDGWCHRCGVPHHEQTGHLTLQRRRLMVSGCWKPNWQFDEICLDAELAAVVRDRFDVELRPVEWARATSEEAYQIVIPSVGESWFDHVELTRAAIGAHGVASVTCPVCRRWKWMPLRHELLPPFVGLDDGWPVDVAGSPEWFGDGRVASREIVARRELAELLVAASPRDIEIVPVH